MKKIRNRKPILLSIVYMYKCSSSGEGFQRFKFKVDNETEMHCKKITQSLKEKKNFSFKYKRLYLEIKYEIRNIKFE